MSLTDLKYVKDRLARLEERIRQVCADFRIVRKRCDDDFINDIWNEMNECRRRIAKLEKENLSLRNVRRQQEAEIQRLCQRLMEADVPLEDDPHGLRYPKDEPITVVQKERDKAIKRAEKSEAERDELLAKISSIEVGTRTPATD